MKMTRTRGARNSIGNFDEQTEEDAQTDSPPAKKPRKKSQAFGVPKTAALKAKIDRNAAESPLLRLPREVRLRIWRYAIGNRLLHIEILTACAGHNELTICRCQARSWATFCCLSCYTEDELFERSKIPIEERLEREEAKYGTKLDPNSSQSLPSNLAERMKARKIHLRKNPHYLCQQFIGNVRAGKCNELEGYQLESYKSKEYTLSVQLLRVCRQVYIEANPVLWSSNTLSFRDSTDFNKFMSGLVAAQKAAITSLVLEFSAWSRYGQRATTSGIVTSLVGLRNLHLYLDMPVYWFYNDYLPATPLTEEKIKHWWRGIKDYEASEQFTNFRRLALSKVNVIKFDDDSFACSSNSEVWCHTELMKYVEVLRETILDPEGSRKFEQEQADAKAIREAQLEKYKLMADPCGQASTMEECAQINEDVKNSRQSSNGKAAKKKKAQARACNAEHVCLICLKELQRSREEARECPMPGNCGEEHFKVMFSNLYTTSKSMQTLIHPEETVNIILTRYISVSRCDRYLPWFLRFKGTQLKPEATVQEIGLQSASKLEVNQIRYG